MPTFTPQQLRAMMAHKNNIRNTTVIAHVDHGKSTLTDTLVRMAGISNTDRYTHGREDERLKGITIKSTGLSLFFELPESVPLPSLPEEGSSSSSGGPSGGRGFLFNLVDTPGHVDFSSEVTAALRVTDGALVVVDCVEGVCVQTETVLRQALAEGIKPVLVLNKLDRVILELQLTPEEAYQALVRTIEDVNTIVATYGGTLFGEGRYQLDPLLGNVTFGSALHGWGFSLPAFARMLARSTDTSAEALLSRLWGENYFDPQTKRWKSSAPPASSTSSEDEKNKPRRGFCKLVLAPIYSMVKAAMASERDTVSQKLSHLGISLRAEDLQKEGKDLMKAVMPKFLSMGDALLEMMVTHLPSPAVAQRYRVELLYEGPMDDACATAIRECDPDGPLMVYISKQVPAMGGGSSDKSRFYSFGRVFSGVVRTGQKVRIMGPDFVHGQTRDLFVDKSVQRTCLIMGRYVEAMEDVPCGNTVCLVGLDKFLVKSGTLTNVSDAHPFRAMKLSVSPVVRVAVRPKKATDIPRLAKGLKLLAKMDTCVQCTIEESTGEMIVAGAGELHLDTVLNDLSSLSGIEITRSDPVVSYRESIRGVASSQACLAKSPNHHNRLWTTAQPMGEDLLKGIEVENTITTYMDPKQRAKILEETYGWPHGEGRRVWSFAPNDFGPNVLVDNTKGVQYMHEIKDSFNSAFQWVAGEGVLCGEPMRGIRFNIVDATLHSDSIHRGGGQIIPAARRALFAAQLSSKPCIQEPIYLVEILTQETAMGGIYKMLSKRRGNVFSVEHREGTPLCMMKAHLPVGESFGFTGELREATGGFAYPQCFFDHWSEAPGDPLVADNGNLANGILMDTRRRKGLPLEVPRLEDFVDKL